MSSTYQHHNGMVCGTPSLQSMLPPNWTWEQYQIYHARHQAGYQLPVRTGNLVADNNVVAPPVVVPLPEHYSQRIASTDCQTKLPPRSPTPMRISTLEEIANLPMKSREPLMLVALHLQRRSPSRPWGIGFVHNNDLGHILVSNVDMSLNTMTFRAHVIPLKEHVLDPTMVYSPSGVKNCNGAGSVAHAAYIQELFESTSKYDISSESYFHKSHARICPGDILVSMDGGCVLPLSSSLSLSSLSYASFGGHYYHCFDSLNAVSSYLRTVQSVCVVLLRCPRATTAAMTGGNKAKTIKKNPFQAASRATAVWMKILPQKAISNAVASTVGIALADQRAMTMTPAPPQSSVWLHDEILSSSRQVIPRLMYPTPAFMLQHQLSSQELPPYQFSLISPSPANGSAKRNNDSSDLSLSKERLNDMSPLEMLSHLAAIRERHTHYAGRAQSAEVSKNAGVAKTQTRKEHCPKLSHHPKASVKVERNPWFREGVESREGIPYDDNSMDYFNDDGARAGSFLPPIGNYNAWLACRKDTWRRHYRVYQHSTTEEYLTQKCVGIENKDKVRETSLVTRDFWIQQGFASFDDWLATRLIQWKLSYSWNARKRKRIQNDCQEVVRLSCSRPCMKEFRHWLRVRRYQWRMLRRQRQRLIEGNEVALIATQPAPKWSLDVASGAGFSSLDYAQSRSFVLPGMISEMPSPYPRRRLQLLSSDDKEIAFIDEILEAKEQEQRRRSERPPIDIVRFFDASQGIPDDVITHCLGYLPCNDHGKLLRIDTRSSRYLRDRQQVWRSLCPQHWVLPRRPRKTWHDLYLSKLKVEQLQRQKQADDLLCKCSAVLLKGDMLQKIEKLVERAEKDAGFDINYVSGVVCERNSVLNLAVIHRRHKVVRWLVDTKGADIETADRGNFTPLLNAAWAGDRFLVRFFLQRRSNRNVLGTQHYSQGIAPPGFKGLPAEKWAEKRGFHDIAKLIQMGL